MALAHLAVLVPLVFAASAAAATFIVAPAGGDFTSVQAALDAAQPGDTVQVRTGVYAEKVAFPRSGTPGAPIVLRAYPGETPILDGTGVPGQVMVLIPSRSHVAVEGLTLRNNLGVTDGSGIRVVGAGSGIVLRGNHIHAMRGNNAMGITVYATEPTPIAGLVIDGNRIEDCEPAPSEALVLNGNVDGFSVTNNLVRDVDNIGIDMIGGETDIQPNPALVARNGLVRGNRVERARSSYGGGFAGGIYVDGGRDIVIENNVVTESDLGIEIGAENAGITTRNVTVRNNVLFRNEKACLVFGGYAAGVGRVRDSAFTGNTCAHNDTLGSGFGELWIQYAEDNVVTSNVFVAGPQGLLLLSDAGNAGNVVDWNVWWTAATPRFVWNGNETTSLAAHRAATGADVHSLFADPLLSDAGTGDVHLGAGSPARDAGDPAFTPAPGETDVDGGPRQNGPRVDAGADESTTCGDGVPELPELCDDGDLDSGDGCDANCTPTGCGNGIVTAGEACDDGDTAAGDCCGATCQHEPAGSPCDDGDACTQPDTCDAGTCSGLGAPAAGCRASGSGLLSLRDGSPDTKDVLVWKWTKGAATTLADLGDPTGGGAGFALCVYGSTGGTPQLLAGARAPGGGTCRGRPCWKALGTSGFGYTDAEASPDGLVQLRLKAGGAGKASITAKGKGASLPPLGLPLPQDPAVTVQLHGPTGTCWETTHAAPAQRATASAWKDRDEP